jgi:hypothetical protein
MQLWPFAIGVPAIRNRTIPPIHLQLLIRSACPRRLLPPLWWIRWWILSDPDPPLLIRSACPRLPRQHPHLLLHLIPLGCLHPRLLHCLLQIHSQWHLLQWRHKQLHQ